jgi:hypothetical protein
MRSLSVILALITGFVSFFPREAKACSPPADFFILEEMSVPLEGVPVQGVVPIFVIVNAETTLGVEVVDSDGLVVPGSFEIIGENSRGDVWSVINGRLVWRSEAPLQANSSYQMTVTSLVPQTSPGPETIEFRTGDVGSLGPEPFFEIRSTTLTEETYVSDQVCCSEYRDSCDFLRGDDCYATRTKTRYVLEARLEFTQESGRYALLSTNGEAFHHAPGAEMASALAFDSVLADRCVTIAMRSLLDEGEHQETACVRADEVIPEDEEHMLYREDVCEEEAEEGGNDGGGGWGCATASRSSSLSLSLFLLLVVAFARRRQA